MNILYLLTQDLESPSGLGRYWPLARQLAHLGHTVTIGALHPDFQAIQTRIFERQGVQIHYVAPMHVRKSGNVKHYYPSYRLPAIVLRATLALYRLARATNADIIHIGKPHPMNSIAGILASYPRRTPLLVDCDDYEGASGNFSAPWQQVLTAWFEKHIPRKALKVTTNTLFMQGKLISWGVPARNISHIPNGVDRTRFQPPSTEKMAEIRQRLAIQGKKIVLYMGSLSLASHAVDLLLEAFARVHSEIEDSALLLVGGGEDGDKLAQQAQRLGISQAVHFCGRIPPGEVHNYYYLSDVSLDPVRDDDASRGRSPLKGFESWMCGVPFITADVGDRRVLLGDPPAGLLIVPDDPQAMAQAIVQVLTQDDLRTALLSLGHARAIEYDWEHLALKMEQVYRSCG